MSTIKAKNIKQTVIGSTIQPLKLGGILDDGSDAKISIDTSGNLTASNLTATLNGLLTTNGQIKFPATQNPSSDANTLDDYEEGTFTPVATPTNGSFVSSSGYGQYVKIGKTVTCVVEVGISNIGSGSNGLNIAGLPFYCSYLTGSSIVIGNETSITGMLVYGYITENKLANILKYDRTSALLNNGSYKLLFTYISV